MFPGFLFESFNVYSSFSLMQQICERSWIVFAVYMINSPFKIPHDLTKEITDTPDIPCLEYTSYIIFIYLCIDVWLVINWWLLLCSIAAQWRSIFHMLLMFLLTLYEYPCWPLTVGGLRVCWSWQGGGGRRRWLAGQERGSANPDRHQHYQQPGAAMDCPYSEYQHTCSHINNIIYQDMKYERSRTLCHIKHSAQKA